MSLMILQLSICIVTMIQLTSSQSTYGVIQQENDVNSCCGRTEQVLSELVTAVSQLQQNDVKNNRVLHQLITMNYQLQTVVLQSQNAVLEIQRDVAEMKAAMAQSTYDGCGDNEQVLSELVTMNHQLQTAVSQLQRDVVEVKADIAQSAVHV